MGACWSQRSLAPGEKDIPLTPGHWVQCSILPSVPAYPSPHQAHPTTSPQGRLLPQLESLHSQSRKSFFLLDWALTACKCPALLRRMPEPPKENTATFNIIIIKGKSSACRTLVLTHRQPDAHLQGLFSTFGKAGLVIDSSTFHQSQENCGESQRI